MILLKWFLLNTKSKFLQHPPFTSIKSKSLLSLMCRVGHFVLRGLYINGWWT